MKTYADLLRRYLLPQGPAVFLMVFALLGATGLRLATPRVIRLFLNEAQAGAPEPLLLRLAGLSLLLALGAQAIRVLAGYLSERVGWSASNRLRIDLAAHLLRLDPGFHQQRTPGELIERVDGDVSLLAALFSTLVVDLAGSLLMLAGIWASLAQVSPGLGLAFAVLAALTLWALLRARTLAAPAVAADREASARFFGLTGEVLTATEEIRSLGAEAHIADRYAGHLRSWLPVYVRAELRSGLVWVLAIAAFGLADGMAYVLSGRLYLTGAIPLGTVYLVVAYAALLAQPLETLRTQMQHLQRADAATGRIMALLATRPRVAGGSLDLPPGPLAVCLEQVRFGYDEGDLILNELSFHLAPGRRLGLLGRTGSGKSTIARLLARQWDPLSGTVRLGGVALRSARLEAVRAKVGLVTQEVQLFAASLRENITLFDPAVPDDYLRGILTTLGLGEWFARLPAGLDTPISPATLSAGEAQLLALARLFLKDPGLVILDEPSSRLDPESEALVNRAMERLLAGRTAVIIAHRLATVERVDEVMILEEGRIVEHGEPERLRADPSSRYAALRQIGEREVSA